MGYFKTYKTQLQKELDICKWDPVRTKYDCVVISDIDKAIKAQEDLFQSFF